MSVTTTADELVDKMRKDVDQALKSTNAVFNAVVIGDGTWGGDEYKEEFKEKINGAQQKLLALKKDLGDRRFFD